MMRLFSRKPKAEPTPEADPQELLQHLVEAATHAALVKTPESGEELAEHLAKDLAAQPKHILAAALGLAIIMEGEARARDIGAKVESVLGDLFERLVSTAPQEPAGDAEPAQADDSTPEPSDAPSAAEAADEKVWTEDRR